MSWIGNVIAAAGALKAADYNKKIFDKQAALNREKALQRRMVQNNYQCKEAKKNPFSN